MTDEKAPWKDGGSSPAFQVSAAMITGFLTQFGGAVIDFPDPAVSDAVCVVRAGNGMRFVVTIEQQR